ncbi:uncharacterized protein LOC128186960 [Crassostrea angulata]|uniref:uncharacterized protein LOC128186960 n=1 Tax=Magallana angulata TaxID=2784310 RepID=UPI0022B136FC|nr:uncharacterized protein LOC128186960 [Crassostrea angulata]
MDVAIFCLVMFVVVSPTYTLEGENICSQNVTTGSRGELETIKLCCKDFEEKNNKCVECSPGFWGWNCTNKCPKYHYGRKCLTKCSCNETQFCHHVCGCLQRLDLYNSNMTNNDASFLLENVTSSPYEEECPSTNDVLSASTVSTPYSQSPIGMHPPESNFRRSFLIGAAIVTGLCIVFGIGLLYRLHLGRNKAECRVHHNMVYDLGDTSRIRENPSVHEEPAEPLYGECSYEDTYSTLVLRVNNESGREPNTSRQPVFTDDDNIYEFAHRYTYHSDEGEPTNVYITGMTEDCSH